ncbi:hypothetical protein ABIE65_005266 [Constrictibacter sp. MBR-5]|jgi:hypothetical protein|uniref:hypothetical protein n=1 Tax=Constrictibacter sp. MBR-5 TaxID=3156467 RepID=UPI0033973D90
MNGEEITDPDTARGIIRIRLGHYLYQRLAALLASATSASKISLATRWKMASWTPVTVRAHRLFQVLG